MKKTVETAILLLLISVFAACTSQREKEIRAITELEKSLEKDAARPDPGKLKNLLDAYVAYVDNHPDDTTSGLYLYKAVTLCIGVNNGARAMELIDRTLNDFPGSRYAPTTIFLKAYVYENLMGNYGQASTVYQGFLKKYPDHELADDAEAALKYLGKSPEELVKEFEARKEDSQASSNN